MGKSAKPDYPWERPPNPIIHGEICQIWLSMGKATKSAYPWKGHQICLSMERPSNLIIHEGHQICLSMGNATKSDYPWGSLPNRIIHKNATRSACIYEKPPDLIDSRKIHQTRFPTRIRHNHDSQNWQNYHNTPSFVLWPTRRLCKRRLEHASQVSEDDTNRINLASCWCLTTEKSG
jgi:hypothetical protein